MTVHEIEAFFTACAAGDIETLAALLKGEPGLARARHRGSFGLHLAAHHPEALRLLLEHGADVNARDEGDNALPLHFAAGGGPLDSVRILLEAGSDVHGVGDLHEIEVIGWSTVFKEPRREVVDLLVEHGARHHVFSAIALGELKVLCDLVEDDPGAIRRRLSPFEQEQTALHYVVAPPDGLGGGTFRTGEHYRTLETLIELGAELEARDAKGRSALAVAMLRDDRPAMRLLHAAGARTPEAPETAAKGASPPTAVSFAGPTPMLTVPDMDATVAWYRTIGFELAGSYGEEGALDWASMVLGGVEIMFVPCRRSSVGAFSGLSLWLRTDRIDEIYTRLRGQQLRAAAAFLAGHQPGDATLPFSVDLHTAVYGQREFGVRDPNGVELMFAQPVEPSPLPSGTDVEVTLRNELRPGDVGYITYLHGSVYAREQGFDGTFEAYVAGPLAEFVQSASERERIWIAEREEKIVGCIGIVASSPTVAQLRWFLVDPGCRGAGLGGRLLEEAIAFCKTCGYESIILWTVSALAAAAHLYRSMGFEKSEEKPVRMWSVDVLEEKYELRLT